MSGFSWTTEGFEAFRQGTFGNGGQNLYVSKAGVLQRIYQYDLNHNGYFDLVFANCQNHHESSPSFVYTRGGKKIELPGQGAISGLAVDLNGDGYTDIVICGYYDMAEPFASTDIYFGSAEPYSVRRHIRIPTPWAESVAAGDFNGGGRQALAFAMPNYSSVRIFEQSELGFEWRRYTDLPIFCNQVAAADLDGDGYAELIVRSEKSTETTIYWGGPNGIRADRFTVVPALPPEEIVAQETIQTRESDMEKKWDARRLLQTIKLNGRNYFTLSSGKKMIFFGADRDRQIERCFELDTPMAMAIAAGDLDGDGYPELAVACQIPDLTQKGRQLSFIYQGGPDGFSDARRTVVHTNQACDVAIDERNGEVIFCQCNIGKTYSNNSLIYRNGQLVRQLPGNDTRRVFVLKNPGRETDILLVNHYARSSVGFDRAYVYWGGAEGYSPENMLEVPCWCGVDSFSADLDDDGWAELLVCNNSENSLHLDPGHHVHHFGPNGFEPEKSYCLPTEIGWGAVCADFNRDGYLDIITSANHWQDLKILYGGPDGFKRSEVISLQGRGSSRWLLAVDLNKNGYLDLVVPLIDGDRTLILHGGPEGFSMDRHSELAVLRGVCARAADLTGNGYPDLIVGSHVETARNGEVTPHEPHHSFIHIYWNGPEGLSESNKTILRADAAVAMAIADFNNDGWLDIFVSNYHNGRERDINSILYWNRQGTFHELDRQLLFSHSASGCVAADFNEDGYIDLAVANHKVDGDHLGYSSVWWNGPGGFDPKHCTNLPTVGPHGMTSLEPGNLLDRGPEEYYISAPYRSRNEAIIREVVCEGEIPPKTWVKATIRSARRAEDLENAPWNQPGRLKVKAGDWVQYQLALGAINSLRTPRINRVTVNFEEISKQTQANNNYRNVPQEVY